MPRVSALADVHCVFVLCSTEFALWRVFALAPVVHLNIVPAEFRHVLGEPYPVHLRVFADCQLESFPPYQIEVPFLYNVLFSKQRSGCSEPLIFLQGLSRRATNSVSRQLESNWLEGGVSFHNQAAFQP
jgi:hypothetical protein